jgi:hypothetical protein
MLQLERLNLPPYAIIKRKADVDRKIRLNDLDEFEIKELVRVAKEGFGPTMPEEEVREVVFPNTVLFVAYKNGNTIGFEASDYSTHQKDELYVAATAVIKVEQGKGLFTILNKLAIQDGLDEGFTNITTRTQNPNIDRSIIRTLDLFIKERQISEYSINRTMIEGKYGRMLTTERQFSNDESMNKIYEKLVPKRGDAYFITYAVKRS